MRLSSPLSRILFILASLAAITALLAGCGDDEPEQSGGPRQLLEEAAAKPIESAQVEMRVGALVPGFPILGSRLSLTGEGPFKSNGRDAIPTLDWNVKLTADGQEFPARLRAVDDRVFVDFMGLSYEADPELIDDLGKGGGEQPGNRSGGTSLEQLGINPADWLGSLRMEDGEDIGGDSTRKITGAVRVSAVVDDVIGGLESSGIRERLGDSGEAAELTDLSEKDRRRLEDAVKDVDVQVNVDDEGYARRAYAKLRFEMPEDVKGAVFKKGAITFDLVLAEVGDVDVRVAPPASPRDLDSLFNLISIVFGIDEPSDLWREPN